MAAELGGRKKVNKLFEPFNCKYQSGRQIRVPGIKFKIFIHLLKIASDDFFNLLKMMINLL